MEKNRYESTNLSNTKQNTVDAVKISRLEKNLIPFKFHSIREK